MWRCVYFFIDKQINRWATHTKKISICSREVLSSGLKHTWQHSDDAENTDAAVSFGVRKLEDALCWGCAAVVGQSVLQSFHFIRFLLDNLFALWFRLYISLPGAILIGESCAKYKKRNIENQFYELTGGWKKRWKWFNYVFSMHFWLYCDVSFDLFYGTQVWATVSLHTHKSILCL